jgi:hypothetical protein
MSAKEVKEWETQQGREDAVLLRRWDDEAKEVGKEVEGLDGYLDGIMKELEAEKERMK